ncbi:hypothetical protein GCM10022629_10130 [Amorphoplanes auranticolor]
MQGAVQRAGFEVGFEQGVEVGREAGVLDGQREVVGQAYPDDRDQGGSPGRELQRGVDRVDERLGVGGHEVARAGLNHVPHLRSYP